jgi:hypothetical protein
MQPTVWLALATSSAGQLGLRQQRFDCLVFLWERAEQAALAKMQNRQPAGYQRRVAVLTLQAVVSSWGVLVA